jgi:hypothetical protein
VILGLVSGLALVGAALASRRWLNLGSTLLALLCFGVSLVVAVDVAVGDPLTYRWVAVVPAALCLASVPGLLAILGARRRRDRSA